MVVNELLARPGEHAVRLHGGAGVLEGMVVVPENPAARYVALLGHPNSLQGGTMQNKVVTTLARAFRECGIPSLRFNFRGVGQSEGQYDAGTGESEDMLGIARDWIAERPGDRLVFAGFSFGSYVAYRAAAQYPHALLVGVAPPVDRCDFEAFKPSPAPWEILMGDADEVVPFGDVEGFAKAHNLPLHRFPETGHFFHGKLLPLKVCVMDIIARRLLP